MRSMDIERLLKWAYVDELPKEQAIARLATRSDGVAPGFLRLERIASTQTVIDEPNRHGVLPDPHSLEGPHPDALIVSEAVTGLAGLEMCLPDDWDPFEDVVGDEERLRAGYGATKAIDSLTVLDRHGSRRLRPPPVIAGRDGVYVSRSLPEGLVIRHAVLGGSPDWTSEAFVVRIEHKYGKPAWYRRVVVGEGREAREVEIDGYNQSRQRPYPDAYQRRYLDPPAQPVAVARAEYELWHAALAYLADELAGRLETIAVLPSQRPSRPWETGDLPFPRILLAGGA